MNSVHSFGLFPRAPQFLPQRIAGSGYEIAEVLVTDNSWEICHRCAKILLAAEHKMQLAYYLQNTDWFQRWSEFGFFDEPVTILFTNFY